MDAYSAVRQAIENKQQIVADYHGHTREMCPHVLGTKNGKVQALFFQFGGGSNSGLPAGGEWRCIEIQQLSNVQVRVGDWHTGMGHTRPQTCVDRIDVEVAH